VFVPGRAVPKERIMAIALSEVEVACLKKLAELFEKGCDSHDGNPEAIGLTADNYYPVLKMLEQHGFIEDAIHTTGGFYTLFRINASAVQTVRAIEERTRKQEEEEQRQREEEEKRRLERKDIVEYVRVTLRKHPVLGWLCVAGIALTALITVLNQLLSLLKNLNWIQ
jgi:hypothetical protein